MPDYQVTLYSDNFKDFLNTTTEDGIFNEDGNLFQSEPPFSGVYPYLQMAQLSHGQFFLFGGGRKNTKNTLKAHIKCQH